MNQQCIFYSTDNRYAYPTLLSALQARQSVTGNTDIFIVALDLDAESLKLLRGITEANGVEVLAVGAAELEGMSSMFGRFFFHRIVKRTYRKLLYMDGDIQVTGSLDDLFALELPPKGIMAVADPLTFTENEPTRSAAKFRAYLRNLGFDPIDGRPYFNSGVVYSNGDGWPDICDRSLQYIRGGHHLGTWEDQSALNVVAGPAMLPLSLRWNFPIFLHNTGLPLIVKPVMQHFMSSPKPWNGVFPPWSAAFTQPYRDLVKRYPEMRALTAGFSRPRWVKYHLQQRYKRVLERTTWSRGRRMQAMLQYEATCAETWKALAGRRAASSSE